MREKTNKACKVGMFIYPLTRVFDCCMSFLHNSYKRALQALKFLWTGVCIPE